MGFWFIYMGLHGADGVAAAVSPAYETARHILYGTSLERHTLHATSNERHTLSGSAP